MHSLHKYYYPYISPYDPCPPIKVKGYETPPQLYIGFQPPNLKQFSPKEALTYGTLWPAFYSPYPQPKERGDQS